VVFGEAGGGKKIFDERTIQKLVFFLLLYDNVSLQLRLTLFLTTRFNRVFA